MDNNNKANPLHQQGGNEKYTTVLTEKDDTEGRERFTEAYELKGLGCIVLVTTKFPENSAMQPQGLGLFVPRSRIKKDNKGNNIIVRG